MNSNFSTWTDGQLVDEPQMTSLTQDIYAKLTALCENLTSGGILNINGNISQDGSDVTVPAGSFIFPPATYAFLPYQTGIFGFTSTTTVTVNGNGFVVARYSVQPSVAGATNYSFPTQILFVATVNPSTDCVICIITNSVISGYGSYLINTAATLAQAQAGTAINVAITPATLAALANNYAKLNAANTFTGTNIFSGPILVPNQTVGDNSQKAANTAYIQASLLDYNTTLLTDNNVWTGNNRFSKNVIVGNDTTPAILYSKGTVNISTTSGGFAPLSIDKASPVSSSGAAIMISGNGSFFNNGSGDVGGYGFSTITPNGISAPNGTSHLGAIIGQAGYGNIALALNATTNATGLHLYNGGGSNSGCPIRGYDGGGEGWGLALTGANAGKKIIYEKNGAEIATLADIKNASFGYAGQVTTSSGKLVNYTMFGTLNSSGWVNKTLVLSGGANNGDRFTISAQGNRDYPYGGTISGSGGLSTTGLSIWINGAGDMTIDIQSALASVAFYAVICYVGY